VYRLNRLIKAALASGTLALTMAAPIAALAQPVAFKFAPLVAPGNLTYEQIWAPWAKKINDAAQGEFQLEIVGPAVANVTNVWERTVNGVVDISSVVLGPSGLPFTKTNVTNLPGIMSDDAAASVALWRLYAKGLISEEFKDVRVLALTAGPRLGLTATKPITKLEDLKGAKVRAIGKVSADILTALGASPIALPFGEVYQSLSRGVISGGIVSNMSIVAFKSSEVAKHHTFDVSLGMAGLAMVMNRQSYDKLSPKGKAIVERFSGESESRFLGTAWGKLDAGMQAELKAKGDQQFHSLSAQEIARWQQAVEPMRAAWVTETPDGARLLNTLKAEYAAALAGK
jgi:TRAP-type C4-dicarboxylate transport system substrate-binding protein